MSTNNAATDDTAFDDTALDDTALDDTALDDTALDDTAFDDEADYLVRPYALTGGRTRNERLDISIQTVVCQSRASLAGGPPTGPVEHEIWAAAAARLSSADISAQLDLPLGVVRVLVGDLAETGHLELGETVATGDAHLIKRLIDGIRAI